MKGRTRVNHPPEAPLPADNRALVGPIHQSVKFAFESLEETLRFNRGEREGYFYTRRANPTTRQLELLLAELQQRDDCVATGSGAAAVATALISQLRAGDHILCFAETYGPTLGLIRGTLARLGITHAMLAIEDDAGIERALAERKTKLVYFESPTNPVTRIADIARITKAAHAAGATHHSRASCAAHECGSRRTRPQPLRQWRSPWWLCAAQRSGRSRPATAASSARSHPG